MVGENGGAAPAEQLVTMRFLAWRPVHSAPMVPPSYAIGGKLNLSSKDDRLINALEPNSRKVNSAFKEARYATRYDGMMVIDLDFDENKLPSIFRGHTLIGLGYKYAEGVAFLAKELSGHRHYFHRRDQAPNLSRDYGATNILKWLYRLTLLLLLAALAWPSLLDSPLAAMGLSPLKASDITRLDAALIVGAALVAEFGWAYFVVRSSRKNWPWGPESPSVVLVENSPASHPNFISHRLPNVAPRARLDIHALAPTPLESTQKNPNRIDWMTDQWLATLNAIPPDGASHTRLAIVQLRRRHLRVIEDALDAPTSNKRTSDSVRRPSFIWDKVRAIAWRMVVVVALVMTAVLGLQMVLPDDMQPMFRLFLFIALAMSTIMFVYFTFLSYLWISRTAFYLRNVLGYVTTTDVMNPIAESIFRNATPATPTGAEYQLVQAVAEFREGRGALEAAIKQEEAKLHTSSFRAAMAVAVLAVTASLLAFLQT